MENADLVNLPNWLPLRYRIRSVGADPGPWLSPDHGHLKEHWQILDLRRGTLTRPPGTARWLDLPSGRRPDRRHRKGCEG